MRKVGLPPLPKNSLADFYRVEVRSGTKFATPSSPMGGGPFSMRIVY
jgi:hypothetical protein